MNIRVSRFKTLIFRRTDGVEVCQDVPKTLDQGLVREIDFQDYLIRLVAVPRKIAESEFASFTGRDGKYIGCLIAGNAILSEENPNNSNRIFAAYSLIVAAMVCGDSFNANYQLASVRCQDAHDMADVFATEFFYAIFKKSALGAKSSNFDQTYFASLFANGLLLSDGSRVPTFSLNQSSYSGDIKIRENSEHPDFIYEILVKLAPYTDNPFLRFFYLYQTIEYLMSGAFKKKYTETKAELDQETDISVTGLRDILEKLTAATKEKTRINDALVPICPSTQLQAEKILDLMSIDRKNFSFAESVYKIRNIIFHDFPKIHQFGREIAVLCDSLLLYLIEKKIM